MTSTPLSRAMSTLYMWKLRGSQQRRVVIELNSLASEASEPACKVTLYGDGDPITGHGGTLIDAVVYAMAKSENSGSAA